MFILNGLALLTVGALNLVTAVPAIGSSNLAATWITIGLFQIVWGFKEFYQFFQFSGNLTRQSSAISVQTAGAARRLTLIPVERKDVEFLSINGRQALNRALDDLARLWIAEGRPSRAELTISGYDDDPRELYEIPQVCAWANQALNENPVLPFFLTNASLDRFVGWLCGPVSKAGLAAAEFGQRFNQAKSACFTHAVSESASFFKRLGADQATVSKFYMQIMTGQEEAAGVDRGGFRHAPAKGFLRRRAAVKTPWGLIISMFIGFMVLGCILIIVLANANRDQSPSVKATLAFSNIPNQPGQICWTYELTNFYGNRSQAWEKFVDEKAKGLLTFDQFKEDVILRNPILKADDYIFFSQKTYYLPELCP